VGQFEIQGLASKTPAMEAGLADHVWTVEELIALLPIEQPKKRGTYNKRQ
jgi:hypothetical protein